MKNKKHPKHKKPLHLHVEHFFRMKPLLVVVLGLLLVAILKADSKMMGMVREASAQGYGQVGSYMREETVRTPLTIAMPRVHTISGR
jgi:hypothetical protein